VLKFIRQMQEVFSLRKVFLGQKTFVFELTKSIQDNLVSTLLAHFQSTEQV